MQNEQVAWVPHVARLIEEEADLLIQQAQWKMARAQYLFAQAAWIRRGNTLSSYPGMQEPQVRTDVAVADPTVSNDVDTPGHPFGAEDPSIDSAKQLPNVGRLLVENWPQMVVGLVVGICAITIAVILFWRSATR